MPTELEELAQGLKQKGGEEPAKKRTKLKGYDLTPHQFLNSMGESGISKAGLDQVYAAMCKGNKACAFFSELCDPTENRKGVAISRLAEVMLKTGDKLKGEVYKKNISAGIYEAAMKEVKDLEPAWRTLMGKGISTEDDVGDTATAGRIAYGGGAEDRREKPAVKVATDKVYAWLTIKDSKLRSLMALLAGGGLFYATSVQEKSHRAYIEHSQEDKKKGNSDVYSKWAQARLCGDPVNQLDDLGGLDVLLSLTNTHPGSCV